MNTIAYIIPGIVGGVIGVIAVIMMNYFAWRKVQCPNCGTKPPPYGMPKNWHRLLWGGWICSECGAEMNGQGKIRKAPTSTKEEGE
jgi:ribosomal protein L37AE/L43A